MSDDSPLPHSKRGTHPNSLANLIPAQRGEPPRNPTGKNGRTRAELIAKILEAPAATATELAMIRKLGLPDDTPLIEALVHREVLAGFGKSDLARKGLREHFAGKPRQQVDVTSDDKPVSGVMLVPVAGDMDAWESASVEAQKKLQEDVRK